MSLTWFTVTAGAGAALGCRAAGGVAALLFGLVALRGSFLGAVFPLGGLLRGLGGFWCSRGGGGNRSLSREAGLEGGETEIGGAVNLIMTEQSNGAQKTFASKGSGGVKCVHMGKKIHNRMKEVKTVCIQMNLTGCWRLDTQKLEKNKWLRKKNRKKGSWGHCFHSSWPGVKASTEFGMASPQSMRFFCLLHVSDSPQCLLPRSAVIQQRLCGSWYELSQAWKQQPATPLL